MTLTVVTEPSLARYVVILPGAAIPAGCLIVFLGVQLAQWITGDLKFVLRLPLVLRAIVYTAGMLGFIFFGRFDGEAFIYFQF